MLWRNYFNNSNMNLGGIKYEVLGSRIVNITQIFLKDSNPYKYIVGHGGTHLYIGYKSQDEDGPEAFFDGLGHNPADEKPNSLVNLRDADEQYDDGLISFNTYIYDGQHGGQEEERFYLKSESDVCARLRDILDPDIHQFSVVKLRSPQGQIYYYFKILTDRYAEPLTMGDLGVDPNLDIAIAQTEREVLQKVRVRQNEFRKAVLRCYSHTCVITGVEYSQILDAAHIKPWRTSTNQERLDPNNGFLIIGTCHKLFDLGLISVSQNSELLVSPFVPQKELQKINVAVGNTLKIPDFNARKIFFDWHQRNIFQMM